MMMTKLLKAFGLLAITAAVASLAPAHAQTTVRYLHTDALGTVVAKTDANGNVVERTTFEPYGAVVGGAVADGPGYTGHVSDAATGLSYMQQRYYDPEVGLFLSIDPVAVNGPKNNSRYAYAANNPYRFIDPDGRDCISKDGTTTCSIPVLGTRIPTVVSFPTPKGLTGIQRSSDAAFHFYRVSTYHQKNDANVRRAIINDPTPGEDKPASPSGTKNSAQPKGLRGGLAKLGSLIGDDPESPVVSYSFVDNNGRSWALNVTQPGHGLHFGIVLRGSVDQSVESVGLGWAIPQAVPGLSGYINDVWREHNARNIEDAK